MNRPTLAQKFRSFICQRFLRGERQPQARLSCELLEDRLTPSLPPLGIGADHRYLVDSAGSPFLIQGDAGWELIISTTQPEADQYLTARASQGFNLILVNLIDHLFGPNAPANMAGQYPFFNSSTGQHRAFIDPPNEAYFTYADWVINRADQLGLYVLLDPSYLGSGGGDEGFAQDMKAAGPTAMLQWGRYVGNRYKDFTNIIWVEGGDYSPPASDKELVNQVALGIEEFSNSIQTAHQQRGDSAEEIWGSFPWLDLNSTYTSEVTYPNTLLDYNRTPTTPSFLIEDIYENEHDITFLLARAEKYWSVLSGSTGVLMGNSPIWGFDYDLDFPTLGTWKNWLDSPLANDMSRLGNVFSSRPWYKLVPDQNHTVVTAGYGTFGDTDYVTTARSADGTLVMAYTPSAHTLTVDMSKLSGPVTAAWYDPNNGSYSAVSGSPFANSGSQNFATPGNNSQPRPDWVLLLTTNSAPVLDNSGIMSLSGILQGATGNGGTRIVDLIASAGGDRITDGNSDAVEGIAVTTADTTNGSWQYSLDDGGSWSQLGAVSATNARLLTADANTRIRFVPNATFNGTVSSALTFRAWDQTAGVNGGTANTNSNGGSTTFSTATETASLQITAASNGGSRANSNAAPSFTKGADQVIAEDGGAQSFAGWATNISSGPPSESGQTLQFLVGTDNDNLFSALPTISATGALTYTPAANANGTATVTVRLKDSGTNNNTSAPQTFTITVNSVSDAPILDKSATPSLVLIPQAPASAIGDSVTSFVANSITDVDVDAMRGIAVVGASGSGRWQFSVDGGTTWITMGAVSKTSARLLAESDRVRFVPNKGFVGNATLKYHAWDQTKGSAGGVGNLANGTGGTCAFSTDFEILTLKQAQSIAVPLNNRAPRGDTLANLIGPISLPPKGQAEVGIAVVGLTGLDNGFWQYSINNGKTWKSLNDVSPERAVLLRLTDRVRFLGKNGAAGAATLEYLAWRQTVTNPGETADLTTGGSPASGKPFVVVRELPSSRYDSAKRLVRLGG